MAEPGCVLPKGLVVSLPNGVKVVGREETDDGIGRREVVAEGFRRASILSFMVPCRPGVSTRGVPGGTAGFALLVRPRIGPSVSRGEGGFIVRWKKRYGLIVNRASHKRRQSVRTKSKQIRD
ncbi:unnamed protein product [Prunus brigantina]